MNSLNNGFCQTCKHETRLHYGPDDFDLATMTREERLQHIGLVCPNCDVCYNNRPQTRCGECGAPNPKHRWFNERMSFGGARSGSPVSVCCEVEIVSKDGRELTAEDFED